ncbi:Rv3235 family protein [Streptomyces sp. N2-109]|uniref:Rv3235 family protein n=1 Tax=Streptomyces gossypii TaxID=2883101 RepID=A0ABT2JTW2_9ACTN|nr:Rv3235 family protein [Streptomyces gossypii]MCT2591321.1 Rv3235 family protein [Streptomyces gossypii]
MTSTSAQTPSALPPEGAAARGSAPQRREARQLRETREARAPGQGPPRAPSRTGPPGRRDTRRPEPRRARPTESAVGSAVQRRREARPHHWFAQQLLLVLSGQRPAHTLLGHVRREAFDELTRVAPRAPLRPRGADRSTPEVVAVGAQQPRSGVVEAYARIVTDGRRQALAFRLELCEDHRWRCAAFELDGPRAVRERRRAGPAPR